MGVGLKTVPRVRDRTLKKLLLICKKQHLCLPFVEAVSMSILLKGVRMPAPLLLVAMLLLSAGSSSAFRPLSRRLSGSRLSMKNPTVFFDIGEPRCLQPSTD